MTYSKKISIFSPNRSEGICQQSGSDQSIRSQRVLARAHAKIERIQRDLLHARGLTREESQVAAKAGLIAPDQMYWWTETWQRGERAAEADVRAKRLLGPFSSVEALKKNIKRR